MDNLLNTSLIQTDIINIPNSYDLSLNNTSINNNVSVNTIIDQPLSNNNNTNVLSSQIEIATTSVNVEKNITINPTKSLIESKNINETTKELIPNTIYQSTTFIKNINNSLIIPKNETQSIFNNTNYNNYTNITSEIINEKHINISTIIDEAIIKNSLKENITSNAPNDTERETNNTKSFLPKNITIPIINKTYDTKYALGIGIFLPVIIIVLLIILICYCVKRKKKSKMNSMNKNYDLNRINYKSSGIKQPYNKLQNTSGINVNMNANNMSMSEIKVQNLKDEIHNIITNSSGGSNSSGRRKRQKKKSGNKNNNSNSVLSGLGKNQGNINNNNEQIKQ